MRSLLALALTALLTGCLGLADGVMKPWMGRSDTDLLAAWGAPDMETKTSEGYRVVTYRSRATDGHIVCSKTFTINRQGTVMWWSHTCPL